MSLANMIAQQGLDAERRLHQVLDRTEAKQSVDRALSGLEEEVLAAKADGKLSTSELESLRRAAQEAGLAEAFAGLEGGGLEALDGESCTQLCDALEAAVRRKRAEGAGDDLFLTFERNLLVSDISTHYQHASNVQKTEHDTYMNIIGNLRA